MRRIEYWMDNSPGWTVLESANESRVPDKSNQWLGMGAFTF